MSRGFVHRIVHQVAVLWTPLLLKSFQLRQCDAVLINNATFWTCEEKLAQTPSYCCITCNYPSCLNHSRAPIDKDTVAFQRLSLCAPWNSYDASIARSNPDVNVNSAHELIFFHKKHSLEAEQTCCFFFFACGLGVMRFYCVLPRNYCTLLSYNRNF